jgi:uncharacterized phage protein (TIGR02220 family)
MAGRIRSLRPEILSDAHNAQLSDGAFRLLTGAKMLADDAGRAPASAAYLGGAVFWGKPRQEVEVERLLQELVASRQVALYEVDGVRYLEIVGWQDRAHVNHQRIEKPSPGRFPARPEDSANVPGILPESSAMSPGGIGIREREEEEELEEEGSADAPASHERATDRRELRALELASAAIEAINGHAGTKYEADSAETLRNARALVKAKVTPDDVRAVVAAKWADWGADDRMRPHFKPSTLLRLSKFQRYLEDLAAGAPRRPPIASGGAPPAMNFDDELRVLRGGARVEGT